jgi:hypothetical protein
MVGWLMIACFHFRRLEDGFPFVRRCALSTRSDTMICGALNYVQLGQKSRVTRVLDQVAFIFAAAVDIPPGAWTTVGTPIKGNPLSVANSAPIRRHP